VKSSRRTIGSAALLALALSLVGAGAPAAKVAIKLAVGTSGDHIIEKMSKVMGEEIEKRVPGRVDWQVFDGGQLGTESETMHGLIEGTHMMTMNGGWFQTIAPELGVFDTPFLFKNRDEAKKAIAAVQDDLAKAILPKGIVLIAIGDLGFREITNNVRPIVTPADLKGIKIRTPGNPFSVETFRTLGANPTPMDAGGLYVALRQGVVDGQENPLATIWSYKFQEVQKYISLSNHVFSPIFIGVSARYWNSWPPEIQQAVREAAQVAADFSFSEDARQEQTLRARLQASRPDVQFNDIDVAAFKAAAQPLFAKNEERTGATIFDKVLAALN
jgi:tripartite ATP-independent transporter DctP family solute receptor